MKTRLVATASAAAISIGLTLTPASTAQAAPLDPPNCGARVDYEFAYPGSSVLNYTWTYRNCGSKAVKVKIVRKKARDLGCYKVGAGAFKTVRWEATTGITGGGRYDKTVTC